MTSPRWTRPASASRTLATSHTDDRSLTLKTAVAEPLAGLDLSGDDRAGHRRIDHRLGVDHARRRVGLDLAGVLAEHEQTVADRLHGHLGAALVCAGGGERQ